MQCVHCRGIESRGCSFCRGAINLWHTLPGLTLRMFLERPWVRTVERRRPWQERGGPLDWRAMRQPDEEPDPKRGAILAPLRVGRSRANRALGKTNIGRGSRALTGQ